MKEWLDLWDTKLDIRKKVLNNQGKYEQAEEMLRQTLELMKTVLGFGHPYTLTGVTNLAGVLNYQGKYEQADDIYRHAL